MLKKLEKKILVIAPDIPRRDLNSGDLRLYSMLKILAQEYEITFGSKKYFDEVDHHVIMLKKFGIKVIHIDSNRFPLKKLLKGNSYDFAIFEFYYTAESYIDKIRVLQPKCRVIVDSVDVHFARLQRKYELTKNEDDYIEYSETKERELCIYRKADAVITVTIDDASEILKEYNKIICEIVPNIHDICVSDKAPENDSLIFVGGFNHPPNVDAVLYFCREIFPLIKKAKPHLKFRIVGNAPPKEIRAFESESIEVTGYVPETSSYLHRSYISVAPLRYGAGMKGKIGEAMAHGIPVVTTPAGAQGMEIIDRENVMIADSPKKFAEAVLELLNDRILYKNIRNNAIKKISDKYSSLKIDETLKLVFEKIHRRPVKKMNVSEKVEFAMKYTIWFIKSRIKTNTIK